MTQNHLEWGIQFLSLTREAGFASLVEASRHVSDGTAIDPVILSCDISVHRYSYFTAAVESYRRKS
jgi:hypothetical protein